MPESVPDKLRSITAEVLGIMPAQVTDSLARANTEEWDSFRHLLLISEVEKRLGTKFSLGEIESIRTFRDLRTLVARKV